MTPTHVGVAENGASEQHAENHGAGKHSYHADTMGIKDSYYKNWTELNKLNSITNMLPIWFWPSYQSFILSGVPIE